jgi:hypothetical protein
VPRSSAPDIECHTTENPRHSASKLLRVWDMALLLVTHGHEERPDRVHASVLAGVPLAVPQPIMAATQSPRRSPRRRQPAATRRGAGQIGIQWIRADGWSAHGTKIRPAVHPGGRSPLRPRAGIRCGQVEGAGGTSGGTARGACHPRGPHPNPKVRRVWFTLDDPHVEQVWAGVIGPSALLVLRASPCCGTSENQPSWTYESSSSPSAWAHRSHAAGARGRPSNAWSASAWPIGGP